MLLLRSPHGIRTHIVPCARGAHNKPFSAAQPQGTFGRWLGFGCLFACGLYFAIALHYCVSLGVALPAVRVPYAGSQAPPLQARKKPCTTKKQFTADPSFLRKKHFRF